MPPPSSLALRHGRLFPLDALSVPELEEGPIRLQVQGTGQTVRLEETPHALRAVAEVPPTAALQWAGAAFPLYIRAARYDLHSGRVHVTVQRPQATPADMAHWASLHGTQVPGWVSTVLDAAQHPAVRALSGPVVGALGALAVLRHGSWLLPAVLAGAVGCRALARQGVPVGALGDVLRGEAVEFDTQVCLHTYVRLVAALDARLQHATEHATSLLSHLGQLVDLGQTQLTLSYVNHHAAPDRPRHGVGLSPHQITLVAGNGIGQGMDWEVSGFLQGGMRSAPQSAPEPVSLAVSLGLNLPNQPAPAPPPRRRQRAERTESPPASPRHQRCDSITERLRPTLRELAR